ncbi:MAG: hypothetical protein NPIRA03_41940 [Nitrospirales bacterium]|nr:MAG: hypothetical protein NPIRA03_41940 [Nitrospirales bacterium]
MHYVYVLQRLDDEDKFYIGYTSDLRQRLKTHNSGGNKSTSGHQWKLVYYEAYMTRSGARIRETRLKHSGKARYQLMRRIRASLGDLGAG